MVAGKVYPKFWEAGVGLFSAVPLCSPKRFVTRMVFEIAMEKIVSETGSLLKSQKLDMLLPFLDGHGFIYAAELTYKTQRRDGEGRTVGCSGQSATQTERERVRRSDYCEG